MKKVPMIWKTGSRRFSGLRRAHPGDTVHIPANQAKVVRALGWATDVPAPVPEAVVYTPPPVATRRRLPPAAAGTDDIEKLRAQVEAKTGTAPDKRWGAARLRQALGGTYRRRDMRAED